MSVKLELFFLLILGLIAVQGRTSLGRCQKPELQKDFDVKKYTGKWHEVVRIKDIPFESGDCVTANYSMNADGSLKVVNSQNLNGVYDTIEGTAMCDQEISGQCYVKFSKFQPWGDYKVIETDYENYSIVYSCTNIAFVYQDMAWILARNPKFDAKSKIDVLKKLGFGDSEFYYTNQDNCPV